MGHCKYYLYIQAGQESFRSITRAYYRGYNYIHLRSIGCILVYDITKRSTFNRIQDWFDEVKADSSEATQMLIVANKIDLSNRDVQYEEG